MTRIASRRRRPDLRRARALDANLVFLRSHLVYEAMAAQLAVFTQLLIEQLLDPAQRTPELPRIAPNPAHFDAWQK